MNSDALETLSTRIVRNIAESCGSPGLEMLIDAIYAAEEPRVSLKTSNARKYPSLVSINCSALIRISHFSGKSTRLARAKK